MRSRVYGVLLALAAGLSIGLAACGVVPENSPVQVEAHRLEPRSAAFGKARYENDGPLFVDQRYDMYWVVVSDQEDVCAALTQTARCGGPDGGTPEGPPRPDGQFFELTFNSFEKDDGATLGERGGRFAAQFQVVEAGEPVFFRVADAGTLSSVAGSRDQIWSSYDVMFEEGGGARGSFAATHCEEMDSIFRKVLYDLPRCP